MAAAVKVKVRQRLHRVITPQDVLQAMSRAFRMFERLTPQGQMEFFRLLSENYNASRLAVGSAWSPSTRARRRRSSG